MSKSNSSKLPTEPLKFRVGCVGGGQLGRMMALEAPRLNIDMKFLDGGGGACPSAQVVGGASGGGEARIVEGALYDDDKLKELSKGCDVVTMEIEHVGVGGLAKLEKEGVNVQPSSRVVGIIQDKYVQKVSGVRLQLFGMYIRVLLPLCLLNKSYLWLFVSLHQIVPAMFNMVEVLFETKYSIASLCQSS